MASTRYFSITVIVIPDDDCLSTGAMSKEALNMIENYRTKDRYERCPETNAIVNAKYQ